MSQIADETGGDRVARLHHDWNGLGCSLGSDRRWCSQSNDQLDRQCYQFGSKARVSLRLAGCEAVDDLDSAPRRSPDCADPALGFRSAATARPPEYQCAASAWPASTRAQRTAMPPRRRAPRSPPSASLDHLVGAGEERGRDGEVEGLRRFKIDGQFVPGRLLDRELGGLLASQNPIDVGG